MNLNDAKSEYRLIFVRTKPGLFLWMSKPNQTSQR